jgi:4-hydroxy-tetrahydrodipicolinate synthase
VAGTTGEPNSLTVDERTELVKVAVAAVGGRIPVVAASGSQSFAETVELTEQAEKAGASALLVVTPYYIKPSHQ